tara:strand:- start:29 stop:526 length:498 start_codon:yes stop_codon:yes gene_type:complete
MGFRIKKSFLFISLLLLQSCSGGTIGNFLESSFKNIEEPGRIEDTKSNLKNKTIKNIKSQENAEKTKNIEEPGRIEDTKNNINNNMFVNPKVKSKNNKKINKQNISRQRRQYQPQSYKIIFILKDVDPKDPIENLSIILRNSDVNFEIEKIERFFDSKNKIIKNN